jgi:hypothetical protein
MEGIWPDEGDTGGKGPDERRGGKAGPALRGACGFTLGIPGSEVCVIGLFIDCEGTADCPPGGAVNPLSDGNDGDVGLAPDGRKPEGLLNDCEFGLVRPDNEDGPVRPDSEF